MVYALYGWNYKLDKYMSDDILLQSIVSYFEIKYIEKTRK